MKAVESVFVISDNAMRKTYRSSNCNETFLFKLTFMLRLKAKDPAGTNFPIPQTFHSLVKRTVPHFNVRCHFSVNAPILFDKLAGLSVVSRGSGNTRAGRSTLTTLPSLQTVYLSCDAPSARATTSICILKSRVNILRGDLFLNEEFYYCALPKRRLLANHFLALMYDHVTGMGHSIFLLLRGDRWV
jgi:hypothetical protein